MTLAKTAAAESKTRARASMFGILLVIRMLIVLMIYDGLADHLDGEVDKKYCAPALWLAPVSFTGEVPTNLH